MRAASRRLKGAGLKGAILDSFYKESRMVNLLRGKFGRLPRAAEKTIRATEDAAQLNAWLVRAGTAATLEEAGFGAGKPSPS